LADLNKALSIDPHSAYARTNRGLAFANQGDVARVRDYDAALMLTSDDGGLYSFRSAARRRAGDEARSNFRRRFFGEQPQLHCSSAHACIQKPSTGFRNLSDNRDAYPLSASMYLGNS